MVQLLKVSELSQLLGVHVVQVYRMVGRGDLPVVKLGRSLRFRESDITSWIEAHSQTAKSERQKVGG